MLVVQTIFDERYYRWAKEDWKRELLDDFPFLRSIKGEIAGTAIRIIEALDNERRCSMAGALAKRGKSPKLLFRWGDPLTKDDEQFIKLYLDKYEEDRHREARKILPGMFPKRADRKSLRRRKLKQYIIKALSSVLGENYEDWGDWEEYRYHSIIGPWRIVTYIDVGGQSHQLCYHHDIEASEHVYLAQGISVLRWLGIASQTDWQCLYDSDAESTAQALAKMIAHFMDAAPKLLEGLSPDFKE